MCPFRVFVLSNVLFIKVASITRTTLLWFVVLQHQKIVCLTHFEEKERVGENKNFELLIDLVEWTQSGH